MNKQAVALIRKIVFRFLDSRQNRVFIFGSRALGNARRFSDIDLGIESERIIPGSRLVEIEEALEESDLPYTVDLVDFRNVSSNFRKVATKQVISLN